MIAIQTLHHELVKPVQRHAIVFQDDDGFVFIQDTADARHDGLRQPEILVALDQFQVAPVHGAKYLPNRRYLLRLLRRPGPIAERVDQRDPVRSKTLERLSEMLGTGVGKHNYRNHATCG